MRPKTLLVLALVVVGLGAFIWFVERDLPTTDERAEREKKLLPMERDEVTAIVIDAGEGSTPVRLERQARATDDADEDADADDADDDLGFELDAGGDDGGDEWRLVAPLQARADKTAVSSLLDTVLGLEKTRTLDDVDRAAAGLDAPRHRVTLVTADGEERTIEVGEELPASSDVLVALTGADAAYQVAGGFVADLGRSPGEWRDRSLFPGGRDDVERLTLVASDEHGEARRVLLARRGEGWWIESPITDRADRDAVEGLVSDLVALEASRFVDEEPDAETDLETPDDVVEAVLAGREEPFRVALGRPVAGEEGERWARVDGQLVTVTDELVAPVGRAPAEWRSKSWTDTQVFRVDRATVEDPAGTMELVRDDADWRRGDETISYTVVTDLLYALSDASAEDVLTPAAARERGLATDSPRLTIRLAVGEGDEASEEVLRLYPTAGDVAPATVDGRDVVLLLAAAEADTIAGHVASVRDAEPLPDEEVAVEDADDEAPAAEEL